jgi:hypothetical protein
VSERRPSTYIPQEVRSFVGSPAVKQLLIDRQADALGNYTRFTNPALNLDIGFYGKPPKLDDRRPLWLVRFPGSDELYAGVCVPRENESEDEFSKRMLDTVSALHKIYPNSLDFSLIPGTPEAIQKLEKQIAITEYTPQQMRMELVAEFIERERRKKPHEYRGTRLVRGNMGPGDEPDSFFLLQNGGREERNAQLRTFTLNNILIRGDMHKSVADHGYYKNDLISDPEDLVKENQLCMGIYVPNYDALIQQAQAADPNLANDLELAMDSAENIATRMSEQIKTYFFHNTLVDPLAKDYAGCYVAVATDDQLRLWQQPQEPYVLPQMEPATDYRAKNIGIILPHPERDIVHTVILPASNAEVVTYSRTDFTEKQRRWLIDQRAHGQCEVPNMGDFEHQCEGGLNVHHIGPQFWRQILGHPEEEINSSENALVVCKNLHIGNADLEAHPHLIHPDHRQAQLAYRRGDKGAYHAVSRRHAELAYAGIPYWNIYNDDMFRDIASYNTQRALRETQTIYPPKRKIKKAA